MINLFSLSLFLFLASLKQNEFLYWLMLVYICLVLDRVNSHFMQILENYSFAFVALGASFVLPV